ncbi:Androglobin [Fasciola gigantica]|uniref:Androglobin n=1 Tax=Fasciola gigantica TaxID=46835 RepID=A0A504YM00_FASGI|nr:Androglobin [Fasciola gigantica]
MLIFQSPVVVDTELIDEVDLFYLNEHLFQSETIRWILCEVQNLWLSGRRKATLADIRQGLVHDDGFIYAWKPWEHIYAMTKAGKEPNLPQYNPYGKYLVRLFWMGCWRKVVVDDLIPFGDDNQILLPRSRHRHELWPMLLTKGLLKIAALDYGGGLYEAEFGDFSPIHALTGWTKHTIVLRNQSPEVLWNYLQRYVPSWERPTEETNHQLKQEEMELKLHEQPEKSPHKESKGNVKEKAKEKKSPADKTKEIVKDKKESSSSVVEYTNTKKPEAAVFASYGNMTGDIMRAISDNKDTRYRINKLSRLGFTHLVSCPIGVSSCRTIPLVNPAPAKPVPRWKLIRPLPSDFPHVEEESESQRTAQEPEPIRSLSLWTPLQDLVFRDSTYLV